MKKTNKKGLALSTANQGFSLVELIIVIAIMAILAAALAPQLMKYIDKSRASTDNSTCASLKNSIQAAASEENAAKKLTPKLKAATNQKITFDITFNNGSPVFSDITTKVDQALEDEVSEKVSDLKEPKQSGKTKYSVTIQGDTDGNVKTIAVETA